ncbi:hypothetical protein BBP40_009621 [Aspergillus hancockii]|nr:hypothetical protein BBP40_009621 [Aspergillus hancockii]
MPTTKEELRHLGSGNPCVVPSGPTYAFLNAPDGDPVSMVSAHAYLGARSIVEGLKRSAQIVICGRAADASPVIAATCHLIECTAYVTGANFTEFDKYLADQLIAPGFPIAEIEDDGTCTITKHHGTQGVVHADTVRCRFLYELQGSVYLNNVSAHIGDVVLEDVGKDRIRGSPPPPTTKLAVFYPRGFRAEILLNAIGYATSRKWDLLEKQIRHFLPDTVVNDLEALEFQGVGTPDSNPSIQLKSTTYMRTFITSGFHATLDMRTAFPGPFLAYYPADIPRPAYSEVLKPRDNYDTFSPTVYSGPTKEICLGDIALARSGDKGANLNFGIFVSSPAYWDWLRSFMTVPRMKVLLGEDWDDIFAIDRMEFPQIHAVHFVVYEILGRGVSSSSRLDGVGKGFADHIRDEVIDVPSELLS